MTIRILSWRADSFMHEADDLRSADNDLLTHAKERMEFRLSQVIAELKAVLETDTGSWDHTFVTLPEFFWNTRWSNVLSEDELMQLGDFYMDHVSDYVNRLIDAFPARSGDPSSAITFLAGTCAILYRDDKESEKTPCHDPVFHAVNWLLCGQNTRSDKSLTMWPKRYVSTIDFFPEVNGHAILGHISAQLPNGQIIHIGSSSEVSAESVHGIVITDYFTNTYADDKPFSIDICLDYFTQNGVRPAGWEQRVAELRSKHSDIDFLIACGMPAGDPPQNPGGVQFLVRNDGMPGVSQCQAWSFSARGASPVAATNPTANFVRFLL
ncbi:TPA: hypothetical protein N5O13_002607 [Enterobacter cloacae subsp. cloacae]|nr:hypothetical protein [Enterobacter cloacae]HAS1150314.1 hypothetical protein [Enterobacter cloacae]HCM9559550.1 hypothetical protein [Enterobacter cloacae subsp. cloacae]